MYLIANDESVAKFIAISFGLISLSSTACCDLFPYLRYSVIPYSVSKHRLILNSTKYSMYPSISIPVFAISENFPTVSLQIVSTHLFFCALISKLLPEVNDFSLCLTLNTARKPGHNMK